MGGLPITVELHRAWCQGTVQTHIVLHFDCRAMVDKECYGAVLLGVPCPMKGSGSFL